MKIIKADKMKVIDGGDTQNLKDALEVAVTAYAARMRAAGLKQVTISEMMGVNQTEVSMLLRGRLALSVERMMAILVRVGIPVSVTVGAGSKECESQ